MTKNQTISPLSIIGVISVGLRIYRDHFRSYFNIALQAYCWSIIPIYGWAKFSALSALIGRLAYYETLEQPEVISEARSRVERRMWSFLGKEFSWLNCNGWNFWINCSRRNFCGYLSGYFRTK